MYVTNSSSNILTINDLGSEESNKELRKVGIKTINIGVLKNLFIYFDNPLAINNESPLGDFIIISNATS